MISKEYDNITADDNCLLRVGNIAEYVLVVIITLITYSYINGCVIFIAFT